MAEYKATFGFDEVVTFRRALQVCKAILKSQAGSEFELLNNKNSDTYKKICKALREIEKQL